LRLTAAFASETFDGSEFIGRYITGAGASFGRVDVDNDGYLWVGHTWGFTPATAITRIDPNDGSLSRDQLAWDTLPAIPGNHGTAGLIAQGGDSLFALYGGYVYRFAMPGGTETWAVTGAYDMDVDDSNNAYTLNALNSAVQLAAADGAITTYTDAGTRHPDAWFGGGVALNYSDELDLVLVGTHFNACPDAYDWQNILANFTVRTTDDSAGDKLLLGTTWTMVVGPYLLRVAPSIHPGYITYDDDYMYVLTPENDGTSTLHKLSWDGASLSIEASATATSVTAGAGIWMDSWDNLVVANATGSGEDRLYYYDPNDLAELAGVANFPASFANGWGGIVPQSWGIADGHLGIPAQGEVVEVAGEWTIGDANQLKDAWLCLYADGIPQGSYYATDEVVADWNDTYTVTIAGINYYSILETFPLVKQEERYGLTSAKRAAIQKVRIDFYDTMGCNFGVSLDNYAALEFSEDDFLTAIAPYSGPKIVTFPRGITREPILHLWEWEPIPMGIRGMYPTLDVVIGGD
jgi:hypothetical protein